MNLSCCLLTLYNSIHVNKSSVTVTKQNAHETQWHTGILWNIWLPNSECHLEYFTQKLPSIYNTILMLQKCYSNVLKDSRQCLCIELNWDIDITSLQAVRMFLMPEMFHANCNITELHRRRSREKSTIILWKMPPVWTYTHKLNICLQIALCSSQRSPLNMIYSTCH